ncbi:hypothetical protein POPTR_001G029300v4 [Populus trichocarpa]|uniref:Uncharacterized protein n=4 Tax=Populus trichocarpa TaxID=3694 RepID=A0ACC0TGU6_POPTR|nr:putative disease resistance RPP13-like protein 1 [Populus trichocarpa]XP_024449321.2 putative disease resistance RPP13-like protein 1 [Populus trichocarpa]XP_052303978.1 putative disease resistance RPP13-like protein 1 [Populus trichocarpa]KAI9400772.1 hypothetical protein POPTR_001G029300v4 [Populus trichocarpa]
MAAALVGGSILSAFLQVLFDRMASREVLDFFKERKLNERLLKKLKIMMISVNGVLDDAEEKQVTKPAVKEWLDELKDAVYEADDLLDEIAYEALRLEVEAGSQITANQALRTLSSSKREKEEMEEKLGEILDRLEYLVQQKDALGLREGMREKASLQKTPTTSLVDDIDVCGRDHDKEAILKLLLSDVSNGKNLDVIPIVGMGGIGKTTLAQLVYNDRGVQESFDLKAWVCVSENFDVFKITNDVLEEFGSVIDDARTPNQLQLKLRERLMGQKFLLVLDDVWNNSYADWDILMRPLKSAGQGSKIIVTTRNESVASVMRTVATYRLKELTNDDCWFLFAKHAFDDGNSSLHPDLQVIGREIVRKCKGLPLAAKTLGGLLRSKRDAKEWMKILRSDMWDLPIDNILLALRLSYRYLPSHLKQCFAYSAIFPKGYEFQKEELLFLWMAEGFINQPKGNMEMEDLGEEYFHDLVSRSFFQQSSGYTSSFVMHDLINDLAKFVSGEFCCRLEDDNSSKISKKARHLSFARIHGDGTMILKGACEAHFLRTLLLFNRSHWQQGRHVGNGAMNNLFLTFRCLRALSLSLDHDVVGLPNSIGNLKHLRYLNLSATSIVRLPDSVSTLYNLQTLILHECKDLIELPTSMMKLINLCHLDITKTKLQAMPSQLSKLTKLLKLTDFFLGKQSGSSINELGKLQHLRGTLRIWNLQNVMDAQNAIKANLKGKQLLKELELTWKGDTNDSLHERLVLEQLQPHMNIECLSIVGYMGTRFPDWIGDSSFSNIVSLKLIGCKYCSSLPPLGQLVSLKDLLIKEFGEIMVVGPEFYGSCTSMKKPFGSLEILTFEGMSKWHEWFFYSEDDEGGAFPRLQKLYINCCPHLTKVLPNCQLPCLTTLEIRKCPQLVSLLPRIPSFLIVEVEDDSREVLLEKLSSGQHSLKLDRLKSLDSLLKGCLSTTEKILVRNCDSLESFPLDQCPQLKQVRIHGCPNLQSLSSHEVARGDVTSLYSLDIRDCPHLVSFPEGGLAAPNMTVLRLRNCSKMKSLPEYMDSLLPSLVEISLRRCPELESFPKGGLPCKLESLEVYACKKLINACSEWNLQKLHSLSRLTIGMCKEVESFPESLRLPPSLCSLKISELQNLKSLDYRELQHLTSLRELMIDGCPKLQSLPEGLPATLTSFKIWALQNLESLGHKGFQHLTALRELEIESCPMLQSMPEEPLPPSLSSLYIRECPLLESRCQREKGEDWHKIQHVPNIHIYATC